MKVAETGDYKLMTIALGNATNNDTFVGFYMTKLFSQGAITLEASF